MDLHEYSIDLRWEGNTGQGTAAYAAYERDFRVHVAGKPDLVGSSDPVFRGDPSRHNPEELLVTALSSCHMLVYLALCARAGIRVVDYTDHARGRMRMAAGGGRFETVTLRPRVTITAGDDAVLARTLHERARVSCFIASSCNFPVTCEPAIEQTIEETAGPAAIASR